MTGNESQARRALEALLEVPSLIQHEESSVRDGKLRPLVTIVRQSSLKVADRVSPSPSSEVLDEPLAYIKSFVADFNSQDTFVHNGSFMSHCMEDLRLICRVYGKLDPSTAKPWNPLGNFSNAEIQGIPTVISFTNRLFAVAPDGIIELGSHRFCSTAKATVLVASFKYNTTVVAEGAADSLFHSSCATATSTKPSSVLDMATSSLTEGSGKRGLKRSLPTTACDSLSVNLTNGNSLCTRHIQAVGSIAMHLNRFGKIHCLEFFYEFL